MTTQTERIVGDALVPGLKELKGKVVRVQGDNPLGVINGTLEKVTKDSIIVAGKLVALVNITALFPTKTTVPVILVKE